MENVNSNIYLDHSAFGLCLLPHVSNKISADRISPQNAVFEFVF